MDLPMPKTPALGAYVTKWNTAPMLRKHSLNVCVEQIARTASNLDFVNIGILGQSGRGKTTLAKTVMHMLHEHLYKTHGLRYHVHIWGEDEMKDFENSMATINDNAILLFDDISYVHQLLGRGFDHIRQAVTKIRHRPDGRDIRLILFYNYHYSKAMDKFMRGTDHSFFVGLTSSEKDNLLEMVGKWNMRRVHAMDRHYKKGMSNGVWYVQIAATKDGKPIGKPIEYKWDAPFRPAIFYNGDRCKEIVFPRREWLAPHCAECGPTKNEVVGELDVGAMLDNIAMSYGRGHTQVAAKLYLRDNGVNAYSRQVQHQYLKMWRCI